MTKEEFKRIRKEDLKLTQQQLADLLDVGITTIKRWESGEHRIPGMTDLALKQLLSNKESELKRSST